MGRVRKPVQIFLFSLFVLLLAEWGDSQSINYNCILNRRIRCNPKFRFRTFSGVCNNLHRPFQGAAGTSFRRLCPPRYDDNVNSPRQRNLPNPRFVSRSVFQDVDRPNSRLSHMSMTFGQFLAHDITGLGQPENPNVREFCDAICIDEANDTPCFGIRVPDDLRFPLSPDVSCIRLLRTVRGPNPRCAPLSFFNPRQQLNTLSSYVDASQVYGVTREILEEVLDINESTGLGLIRTVDHPVNPALSQILPPNVPEGFCRTTDPNRPCLLSGDFLRTTENQALASMHTIWAREHNRIARELRTLNPSWTALRNFREARKILIAIMQHVTYNEWIPVILNSRTRRRYDLFLRPRGRFFGDYNAFRDASVPNSMATAAMRFGHSLIQNQFDRRDVAGAFRSSIPTKTFFDAAPVYDVFQIGDKRTSGLDAIVRGLATQRAQAVDSNIAKAVTQTLVQDPGVIAADLVSLNIQRGRDHGLPSYNDFRAACGIGRAKSFSDFAGQISQAQIDNLVSIYSNNTDGVDLFVGGLAENPMSGGQLGPTFSCIMGESFKNLRFGDRFWYETDDEVTGFTIEQLDQVRNSNIARLICDNADGITQMQTRPFLQRSSSNPVLPCVGLNEHPRIDLSVFKEAPAA